MPSEYCAWGSSFEWIYALIVRTQTEYRLHFAVPSTVVLPNERVHCTPYNHLACLQTSKLFQRLKVSPAPRLPAMQRTGVMCEIMSPSEMLHYESSPLWPVMVGPVWSSVRGLPRLCVRNKAWPTNQKPSACVPCCLHRPNPIDYAHCINRLIKLRFLAQLGAMWSFVRFSANFVILLLVSPLNKFSNCQ